MKKNCLLKTVLTVNNYEICFIIMPSNHICTLDPNAVDESCLPPLSPTATVPEKIGRFWREITLISMKNPRCRMFFRSQASIEYERRRHLRITSNVFIHPFSTFRSGNIQFHFIYVFTSII